MDFSFHVEWTKSLHRVQKTYTVYFENKNRKIKKLKVF